MGLDITAYRQLKKMDAVFDEDGDPINPVTRIPFDRCTQFRVNGDFPGRNGSVEHRAVYAYEEFHSFRAGSYGSYNAWRDELAKLAGYPAVPVDRYKTGSVQMRHDQGAWDSDGGHLFELICFSDCEGVIGPETSAKLAKDFADLQSKIDAHPDEYFRGRCAEWRKAFEMAADGGAVDFH